MRKKQAKLKTLRPSDCPAVGQAVLAPIDGINLPLVRATIRKVDEKQPECNPGLYIQSVYIEDSRGFGGWFDLWDRQWASGPVFHAD